MKGLICLLALGASFNLLAGIIGGGSNPPAREVSRLNIEEFKSLAFDAVNNPDMSVRINGKLAKPVPIDLRSKMMRFKSTDQRLMIDAGQQTQIDN